jgi:hypothetical protein
MDIISFARQVCLDAYNSDDFSPLLRFASDATADSQVRSAAGLAGILGAAVVLSEIIDAAKARGFGISVATPSAGELHYLSLTDPKELVKAATTVINAAKALRSAAPNLRATVTPDDPAEVTQPKAPMEVVVRAMPARKTVTAVSYDEFGNIVEAAQVEQDLPE